MIIEAVTVCVDYSDFLAETAKCNLGLFDSWVIVTTPKDTATRELCRRMNLRCVQSEDGHQTADFAKGRLVERGLQHLSADGWRLHIDADMALPHDFRHRLQSAHLQEDCIYGIDRVMVEGWEQWQKLLQSGFLNGGQYQYHSYMKPNPLNLKWGTRWTHPQLGYVPIGFFQLWHSSQDSWRGVRVKPYPSKHGNACRTDVQHALQWDRHKRELLPEIVGVHLESQNAKLGANWNGRKTKRFGPPAPKPEVTIAHS